MLLTSQPSSTFIDIGLDSYPLHKSKNKDFELQNFNSFTLPANNLQEQSDSLINIPQNQVSELSKKKSIIIRLWRKLDASSINFILICITWYSSSSITNNIGKLILLDSNYPLTLTYVQFGIVALFCYIIRCFCILYETYQTSAFFAKKGVDKRYANLQLKKLKSPFYVFPSRKAIQTCLPLACFQISTHICTSYATAAIPVSFVHTIKALSPLFTVICYRLFWSVKYSTKIYLALFPLTVGVMMFCFDSVALNFVGIFCSLLSCIIHALQSILTKKHLFKTPSPQTKSSKLDLKKIDILFLSSILAFTIMFPIWWVWEGKTFFIKDTIYGSTNTNYNVDPSRINRLVFYYLLNGGSQCAQALLSFTLLTNTDVVTFSVASQLKRVIVITTAMIFFGQSFTYLRAFGFIFTVLGLFAYDKAK